MVQNTSMVNKLFQTSSLSNDYLPFSVDPDIETTVTVISKFDVRRKLEGDTDIEVDTAIRPNKLYMDRSTNLFLNINAGVLIGAFVFLYCLFG